MADRIYSYKEYLETFNEIGDAIRSQTGRDEEIRLVDIPDEINSIPNATGGKSRPLVINDDNYRNNSTYFPSAGVDSSYNFFTKVDLQLTEPPDLSKDTVSAERLVDGTTAHNSSGQQITGSIPVRDSNSISLSRDTITIENGFYQNKTTKLIEATPVATPVINVTENGLITVVNNQDSGYVIAERQTVIKQLETENDKTQMPGTTDRIVVSPGKYVVGNVKVKGDPNLASSNIKGGTSIFGVSGEAYVVDTSDANATANDIVQDKTAYVNGAKLNGVYDPYSILNGVTGTYTVYPGSHVTAGDIISIYGDGDYEIFPDKLITSVSNEVPRDTICVSILSPTKVMLIYSNISGKNTLFGVLLTINDDYSITISSKKLINDTNNASYPGTYPAIVAMSETKAVILYSYSSSYYLYGSVITISGSDFIVNSTTELDTTTYVAYSGNKAALRWSNNQLILAFSYTSDRYPGLVMITVSSSNSLSIGVIGANTERTNIMHNNNEGPNSAFLFKISSSQIFLISSDAINNLLHACIFSVSGSTIVPIFRTLLSPYYSYGSDCIQLSSNKYLWTGPYNSQNLMAVLITTSATAITMTPTQLTTTNASHGGVRITALGDDKYLIIHVNDTNVYQTIIKIIGNAVSIDSPPIVINQYFLGGNKMWLSGAGSDTFDLLAYRDTSDSGKLYAKIIFHAPYAREYSRLDKIGVALKSGSTGDSIPVKVQQ